MVTLLDDPSVIDHQDLIRMLHGLQPTSLMAFSTHYSELFDAWITQSLINEKGVK